MHLKSWTNQKAGNLFPIPCATFCLQTGELTLFIFRIIIHKFELIHVILLIFLCVFPKASFDELSRL